MIKKIFVPDGLAPEGLERLRRHAEVVTGQPAAMNELRAAIADADAVIVRSKTRIDGNLLDGVERLRVIARAGVGVDNIDVDAATRRGILVLNTPESSSVSTAEHTMAMILALARRLPAAHVSLSRGEWQREKFTGLELYGKTLGVIGLGKIGTQVARRAAAFGMRVLAFDPFLGEEQAARSGAELAAWEAVLEHSDILTLHVPLSPRTRHMIGEAEIARMRPGALIINCARGGLIDEDALLAALEEERLGGAALDVFEEEPPGERALLRHPRVVATPHLGASTTEAQRTIAVEIADQVLLALEGHPVKGAVNAPVLHEDVWERVRPFMELARTLGTLAQQMAEGSIQGAEFTYEGEVASEETSVLSASFLCGLLSAVLDQPINVVNAAVLARERGLVLSTRTREHSEDFSSLMMVRLDTDAGPVHFGGTLFGRREPRITHLDGYRIDLTPSPHMLFIWNVDRPGMIGRVGMILGDHDVNIAGMQVGRAMPGGTAVMVLTVDSAVPPWLLGELAAVDGITAVRAVEIAPATS